MSEENAGAGVLDIAQIKGLIPHRYPMLLIDRIVGLEHGERARGVKNVTVNEPFFQGHFPAQPIMPGVLIIEAMAQTAAAVTVAAMDEDMRGKLVLFMSIESAKFRRPVVPGDQLFLDVEKERARGPIRRFKGVAKVDDKVCAEATFSAMIADPD